VPDWASIDSFNTNLASLPDLEEAKEAQATERPLQSIRETNQQSNEEAREATVEAQSKHGRWRGWAPCCPADDTVVGAQAIHQQLNLTCAEPGKLGCLSQIELKEASKEGTHLRAQDAETQGTEPGAGVGGQQSQETR
jgi:hypothetical protein